MKIIFIYNAKAGAVNAFLDSAHKLISPDTYECNLCDLTYGLILENKQWKTFRKSIKTEMIFLHKDEFLVQYKSKWLPKYTFPIILSEENNKLDILITTEILNTYTKVEDLIAGITAVTAR